MATYSSVLAWRIPGTGGVWWAAVDGVAQSRTRLKRLSSSSSSSSMIIICLLQMRKLSLSETEFLVKVHPHLEGIHIQE